MKRTILLAVILFSLLTSAAQAEPFSPEVEAYYANAVAYWGHEPSQCKTITKEARQGSLEQSKPGLNVIGEATQPLPGSLVECYITIDEAQESWQLCRTVMHEVGHLEGLGHSGEPSNIMYPYITREAYAPGCPEPPAVEWSPPQEPILTLNRTYNRWQKKVARCRVLTGHWQKVYCWEEARWDRWAYEEESSKY